MKNHSNSLVQNAQHKEQNTDEINKTTPNDAIKDVIMHHLNSFLENDLAAVMSVYTNESVLITQVETYTGLEEIEAFFAGLITHFPTRESSFELDKMIVNSGLAYIVWHAKTPSLQVPLGSDTFIIKDDKIYQQTFVAQLEFINP